MPAKQLPSAAYLRKCLDYNSTTGVLTWNVRPRRHFATSRVWNTWNSRYAETIAGSATSNGYLIVCIDRGRYLAHRIIWKIMTASEPPDSIDHVDLNRKNNSWRNLRQATRAEQDFNCIRNKAVSGYRNVYRHRRVWKAQFMINGVSFHMGPFRTAAEASAAYESIARNLHGDFYRMPTLKGRGNVR